MENKTLENLMSAFAGESQANRKYTAYAKKAEKEGKLNAAKLFKAAADAEKRRQRDETAGVRVEPVHRLVDDRRWRLGVDAAQGGFRFEIVPGVGGDGPIGAGCWRSVHRLLLAWN